MKDKKNITQVLKVGGILDILICLLLFIFTIHKGGFYKEDMLFTNVVLCAVGFACIVIKLILNIKDHRILRKSKLVTVLDICVIVFPICYFLPIIFKKYASLESSIFEAIRYVGLAIIYFIVRSSNNKKIYIYTIIVLGIILAITGLDEITYRSIGKVLDLISIRYLENSDGRISSTIQYANITALIMLISSIFLFKKVLASSEKILQNKGVKDIVVFSIKITMFLILQSAVILTTSRMNIFLLIVVGAVYTLYWLLNKNKKKALSTLLITILPFVLVASIEKYLLAKNYDLVYITYILTFLVTLIISLIKYKELKIKEEVKVSVIKEKIKNKKTLLFLIITIIGLSIILISIPTSLSVDNRQESQEQIITRSIYNFNKGALNTVSIQLETTQESEYLLEIYEVVEDFSKELKIIELSSKSMTTETFEKEVNISENTIRLKFILKVTKGKVKVQNLNVNNNDIKLSYLFVPDTIVFRIKDTLNGDINNKLRMGYYKDAMKLVNFSPVIGIGGEGFKARYQEVQETPYISSEAHSVPLQILVESGILGLIIYSLICIATIILTIYMLKKKYERAITYLLVFGCYIIASTFDLVFSFEIMICIFAVIVGIVANDYKNEYIKDKDLYKLDNKSMIGMIKIMTLSLSCIMMVWVTVYSYNIYIASMIVVPEQTEELKIEDTYNLISCLEEKIKYDKYNVSYLSTLSKSYESHIMFLNGLSIKEIEKEMKESIREETNDYIIKQKNIIDSMIEFEFYNKYVLEQVARGYFDNYIAYASLYKENFKSTEIAYSFYLNYAIKLTERISKVGPHNAVGNQMVKNIYNEYIPHLKNQNKYIMNPNIDNIIQKMEGNLQNLK